MEFSIHVGLAIAAARSLMEADTTAQDSELSTPSHTTLSHKKAYKTEGSSLNRGVLLTSAGPAALPPTGNILDDPDLVWTEDTWTEADTAESLKRLQQQGVSCSGFWRQKYVEDTGRNWNNFYKRNKDHFYKDRHYLHVVFPELDPNASSSQADACNDKIAVRGAVGTGAILRLLEVGCGVGNAMFPLLQLNPNLYVHAIDHAKSAITILKENAEKLGLLARIDGNMCNVITDVIPVPSRSLDIVLCMFVLSAIAPELHQGVINKLGALLKPGGKLLIRDYGRYDEAQLRFGKGAKLSDNFYVRQDGTCSYFFSEDDLYRLARNAAGGNPEESPKWKLEVNECYPILRQYANRKQKSARRRVWMHAKLTKTE